jgi:hypothetical protein
MGDVKEAYLRKQLAETDRSAAVAKQGAADAQKTASEANKGTADALVEQERLRKDNLVLQSQLLLLRRQSEPRRLTGEQKAALVKQLSGSAGGVTIVSPLIDGEALDFADDFDSALQTAHWKTGRVRSLLTTKFGVAIVTVEGTVLRQTKQLSDALTAIGVQHEMTTAKEGDGSTGPVYHSGYLYLLIEHKPLPSSVRPK